MLTSLSYLSNPEILFIEKTIEEFKYFAWPIEFLCELQIMNVCACSIAFLCPR